MEIIFPENSECGSIVFLAPRIAVEVKVVFTWEAIPPGICRGVSST